MGVVADGEASGRAEPLRPHSCFRGVSQTLARLKLIHFTKETGRLHPSEQDAASAQADLNERTLLMIPSPTYIS